MSSPVSSPSRVTPKREIAESPRISQAMPTRAGSTNVRRTSSSEQGSHSADLEEGFHDGTSLDVRAAAPQTLTVDINNVLAHVERVQKTISMVKTMSTRIMHLKTLIKMDYFNVRARLAALILMHQATRSSTEQLLNVDEDVKSVHDRAIALNDLLIDIKSCDLEFPYFPVLRQLCAKYSSLLRASRPNMCVATEEEMRMFQDRVSLCQSISQLCDMYDRHADWMRYYDGNATNVQA